MLDLKEGKETAHMETLKFYLGHPENNSIISRAQVSSFTCKIKMAASFFNRIAALGIGVAAIGGVVNTALYNGKMQLCFMFFQLGGFVKKRRMIWKIVKRFVGNFDSMPSCRLELNQYFLSNEALPTLYFSLAVKII